MDTAVKRVEIFRDGTSVKKINYGVKRSTPLVIDVPINPELTIPISKTIVKKVEVGTPVDSSLFDRSVLMGEPGRDGGTFGNYNHEQTNPSSIWTIGHNLGRKPNVEIIIDDKKVESSVNYVSDNIIEIRFKSEEIGTAYLV